MGQNFLSVAVINIEICYSKVGARTHALYVLVSQEQKKKRISPIIRFSCFIPVLILCVTGCPIFSLSVTSASVCGAQTQLLTKNGPHMISWMDLHFLPSRPLSLQIGMSDWICCQNP